MQGVVSEIYQHSTSLSQCIQGRDLEMEEVISLSAESPPKRCRVSSKVNGMQTSVKMAVTSEYISASCAAMIACQRHGRLEEAAAILQAYCLV
eukprot:g24066.t1